MLTARKRCMNPDIAGMIRSAVGQCVLLAKCQHLTRFHIVQRMTPETLMMTLNQEQLALSTTACGTSQKTALTICTGTELTCKRLNGRNSIAPVVESAY